MGRSRRVVVDDADFSEFENIGLDWFSDARGVGYAVEGETLPPEEDFFLLSVPNFHLGDGVYVDSVAVWGMGLVTFGDPTKQPALLAHMKTLTAQTDPADFLAELPGDYIAVGFRPGAYQYRDWVIRALNQDLPYDEFVRQQLAGDPHCRALYNCPDK